MAAVFGVAAPLAETNSASCAGSGGLGYTSVDTNWKEGIGGTVIETETTAPRYGNKTSTVVTTWDGKYPPNLLTVKVTSENENLYYVCQPGDYRYNFYVCLDYAENSFPIRELGIGKSSNEATWEGLTRHMDFSVDARTNLKLDGASKNLLAAKVTARAYQVYKYPPINLTSTYRPLGWSEYTVAGQYVGKYLWNAYTVTLNGYTGTSIDITPKAAAPLYFFHEDLASLTEK